MRFHCPECGSFSFELFGSRFSTIRELRCTECESLIAEIDQMDFVSEDEEQ